MKIQFKRNKRTVLKLLRTASTEKKLRVLNRLDGMNDTDTIKILLKVLEDTSWVMREKAAYKLARYGKRVVPRLVKLLDRGFWYTRAAACIALGEIADAKTVGPIVTVFLNDGNPTVQQEAVTALIKIARKKPPLFSAALKALKLDETSSLRLMLAIETNDAEIYQNIKDIS
ncbi:MAG: HEAT repeat domain-containing protein [candidate division WOR-3 bacterium]|nr:MAG: HEAT repeat domain-containing protein [candidate division WOR-3 bacterium]